MNPYHEVPEPKIVSAQDLFGNFRLIPTKKKQSERGELLRYFSQKLDKPIGFVAMKCARLTVEDLYYMKSVADRYENESKGPWGKCWNGMLKLSPLSPLSPIAKN